MRVTSFKDGAPVVAIGYGGRNTDAGSGPRGNVRGPGRDLQSAGPEAVLGSGNEGTHGRGGLPGPGDRAVQCGASEVSPDAQNLPRAGSNFLQQNCVRRTNSAVSAATRSRLT